MIFYTIELQSSNTGAAIVNAYTSQADAEEKYYEILKFAVKSNVRCHGAMVLDETGFQVKPPITYTHALEP